MGKLILDSDEIAEMCRDGAKFSLTPEVEDQLVKLLKTYEQVGLFIEEVKTKLKETALERDKNFTGLLGDKIKLELRPFGSEFKVENVEEVPAEYVNIETNTKVDMARITKEIKAGGEIPAGIKRIERENKLVIKLLDK